MALLDELIAHRAEIYAIAAKHGVEDIRVFGSVARREEKQDSDIDFLVRMEKGRSYFDLIRFKRGVEIFFSRRVDAISTGALHNELFRMAVLKDAATRKQVHLIQEHLAVLSKDFERFQKRMNNLSTHIEQAHKDVSEVNTSAQKISQRFIKIEKVELETDNGQRPLLEEI